MIIKMEILLFFLFIIGFLYLSGRIRQIEDSVGRKVPKEIEQPQTDKQAIIPPFSEVQKAAGVHKQPQESLAWPVFNQPSVEKRPESDKEFEFKVGSRGFTGVGVIAVLFGVGFFLRYAFYNTTIL